ncbi:MAG: hypothetical protein RLZ28_422 [Actinomycetota bacterium]
MTLFSDMTAVEQIASLSDCVAEILAAYNLGKTEFESINHEYNSTFKVTAADDERFALRININSPRTLANLNAEVFWVNAITNVKTPKPVANSSGNFVSQAWHEASGRKLNAVLYTWLDGEELGDEPSVEQLRAAGAVMAKLHETSKHLELPAHANLPDLSDFFWSGNDLLLSDGSELDAKDRELIAALKTQVDEIITEMATASQPQLIHADVHPWNLMWHEGEIAVFDFDDSGIGLPIQDLATALYYLDTDEQEEAFIAGYTSVRELPVHTAKQMRLLKHQRRVLLLNYLYESINPEHREMIGAYQEKTMRLLTAELVGSGSDETQEQHLT